jgi:hypothetical protein
MHSLAENQTPALSPNKKIGENAYYHLMLAKK